MDDDSKCDCPPPGLPLWMGTFADLMSLLMCFFVLLLSFSEMDVLKFKQIAGSMKFAFGVQNRLEVKANIVTQLADGDSFRSSLKNFVRGVQSRHRLT